MQITKMHGLGNDFIIINNDRAPYAEIAKILCARRVNVGADGLLAVENSDSADMRMRIFNSDGTEAEMCGNGIRCFARYLFDRGIVPKTDMEIETGAGIINVHIEKCDGDVCSVTVEMGKGEFRAGAVPVLAEDPQQLTLESGGRIYRASAVRMGVPHIVVFTEDLHGFDVIGIGAALEKHPAFPQRTNVNFAQLLAPGRIAVRTYERGVGPTMACGTGSTSVALIAKAKGLIADKVQIILEAGELSIRIDEDGVAYMTGPAEYVFEGEAIGM